LNKKIDINWKELFDHTIEFMGIIDKSGNVLYINNSALNFIGKKTSSIIGKPFWQTPWWTHSKKLQKKLKESIKKASGGKCIRFETVHFSKEKKPYNIDFSLKPKYDMQGNVDYLIAEGRDISYVKIIEKRLKVRQRKLSQLSTAVEQSPSIIVITDLEGDIVYTNPKFSEITGYSREETAGKNPRILKSGEKSDKEYKELWDAITSGKEWKGDFYNKKKNEELYWEAASITPIFDNKGKIINYLKVAEDISIRKNFEQELEKCVKKRTEELAESEEFNRTMVESSKDCVKLLDKNGNLIYMNQGGRNLLEIENVGNFLNTSWINFWKGQDKQNAKTALRRALKGDAGYFEGFCPTMKGRPRWWGVLVSPIFGIDGNVEKLLAVSRDITQRKKTEKDLKESEKKFRGVFENVPFGMAILNINGFHIENNKSLSKMVGYSREELKNMTFKEFTHPEDAEKDWHLFKKLGDGEIKSYQIEKRYIHKKGSVVWGSLAVSAVRDHENKPYLIIGMVEDITNIKKLENKLKKSYEVEKTLVREIHHRVKNNLQLIISMIRLQSRRIKNKDIKEIFKESQNRIKTISLIHEKLYRSKDVTSVNLQEYASFLVDHLISTYNIDKKRIKTNVDTDQFYLSIDDLNACGLILNELVSNALKYAFAKTKKGNINIKCRKIDRKNHRLIVYDNGVGLPEDFDIKKSDTLGFDIIKTLVKQSGGSIKIESKNGTKVTVNLKRKK